MANYNVDSMSASEIFILLNSGKYLSSTIKQRLQDKLNLEKQMGNFTPMQEFFALIAPKNPRKQIIKQAKEEFPTITNAKTPEETAPSVSVLDFTVLKQSLAPAQIDDKSLITDNKIIIPYDNIKKMYNDFAIHRIRMNYLCLNRNIYLLGIIPWLNPKGDLFKEKFKYDTMVHDESIMRTCLKIYMGMQLVIECMEYLLYICVDGIQLNLKFPIIMDNLGIYMSKIHGMTNLFSNEFSIYLSEFSAHINDIGKLIESLKNHDIIATESIEACIMKVRDLVDRIVRDFDPHIHCEYFVELKKCNDTNIVPYGLSSFIYLDYLEELRFLSKGNLVGGNMLRDNLLENNLLENNLPENNLLENNLLEDKILIKIHNKQINFKTLRNITEDQLNKMLNSKKKFPLDNFIHLWFKHPEIMNIGSTMSPLSGRMPGNQLYIHFCMDEIIPESKIIPEIIGGPDGLLVSGSMIQTMVFDNYDIMPAPTMSLAAWLKQKTRCDLYTLETEEYQSLPEEITKQFSHMDTTTNEFTVKYLFDGLQQADKTKVIIKPEMVKSFKQLVRQTSNV